jgi:hypothetical protein
VGRLYAELDPCLLKVRLLKLPLAGERLKKLIISVCYRNASNIYNTLRRFIPITPHGSV